MTVVSIDYRHLASSPQMYDVIAPERNDDGSGPVDVRRRLERDIADTRAEYEKQVELSSALLVEVQAQVPQPLQGPAQDPTAAVALCLFGVYSTLQQAIRRVDQRQRSREELIEDYIAQHPEYDELKLRAYLYGIAFE